MNRHERRAKSTQVARATRYADKHASEMMNGPAGKWHEMDQEQYREAAQKSLMLSTFQHGEVFVPGPLLREVQKAFLNNHFEVLLRPFVCEWGKMDHLSVRRIDRKPIREWGDLQRIKTDLLPDGSERTAVEVYPPTGETVDQAHWYHLWVLPAGFALPFSLDGFK